MTYKERLLVPAGWWLMGALFALVWGWIMLVATTTFIAWVTIALVATAVAVLLFGYGAVLLTVDTELRVGQAHIDRGLCGEPEVLEADEFRAIMGVRADARAYIVTRPYLRTGVLIPLIDDRDPTPYWLVASRRPEEFARAIGQTESDRTESGPTE